MYHLVGVPSVSPQLMIAKVPSVLFWTASPLSSALGMLPFKGGGHRQKMSEVRWGTDTLQKQLLFVVAKVVSMLRAGMQSSLNAVASPMPLDLVPRY